MEYIYLLSLGFFTGIISSYFGIGGAAVIVPVLYHYFPELGALTIIGCSLGVILLNSTYNTFLFYRSGIQFAPKIFAPLIPTIILGALSGTYLAELISALWLKRIFAGVLILVTLKTILVKIPNENKSALTPKVYLGLIIGYLVGLITGITGLGGGTLLAPTFLVFYKMKPKIIPAYNNLLMIVASSSALMHFVLIPPDNPILFPQFQIGQSNWAIIFIIFVASLFTAQLGVKLNEKTSDTTKKYVFVALLSALAINLLFKTL